MAVDMAIDSQQQPGTAPAIMAAPIPVATGSRAASARITRAEAADYVAKYDHMRKQCAQRLREKFFSGKTPEGQPYYESEVQIGEFVVKESTEDPLDRFTTGLGQVEELQEPTFGSSMIAGSEMHRSMNRLKSQARKK